MPDISTFWSPGEARGDWRLAGPDLTADTDLETVVLISLFTDRRAESDDLIPDGSGDPRGWWGDAGRDRPLGSRLWLLERAKRSEDTRLRAVDYISEALAWLIEDGVAEDVQVSAEWQGRGFLGVRIVVVQADGPDVVLTYQWAWEAVG